LNAPGPVAPEAALARFAQELVRKTGIDCRCDEFKQAIIVRLRAEGLEPDRRTLARWLMAARRACLIDALEST
jgi:hypothetical protein